MKKQQTSVLAAAGLALIGFAGVAAAQKPAPQTPLAGQFNRIVCTVAVDGKPQPQQLTMPYPASNLVYAVPGIKDRNGNDRHYAVGLVLANNQFDVNLIDRDHVVQQDSFSRSLLLIHARTAASGPVDLEVGAGDSAGQTPQISVRCLSR